MKKKTWAIILGSIVLAVVVGVVIFNRFYPMSVRPNYAPSGQVAAKIDDFQTVDLNGETVTNTVFADYELTMINIWTTSCSPCLKEMPDLAALDMELESSGFNVIGIVDDVINADTGEVDELSKELAMRICEQTGATYTMLVPDNALKSGILNGLGGYPSTYFVDKDGNFVGKSYFGARSKTEWKEIIESLLADMEGSK